MEQDPYEVLDLPIDATTDQIQQRFEEAVLGCHPSDLTAIHAACALLMDEGRRREWDRQRPAVGETLHEVEEEEERWRLREEEMLVERQVEFNRDRSRRQRQRRPSSPPPYSSTDYGTCSAEPPPYSPPSVRRQKAPRNRDEMTPLFPNRPQVILPGFRRRATACNSAMTAAAARSLEAATTAFGFMITAVALVLQLLAVAFISASAFAIPAFVLFGIIWLIAMGLMGLVNALGRVQWPSVHWPQPPPPYERNIAIVGAGPAGVTTAYQLSQLCSQQGIPVQITIYEQSSHIGGRAVHSIVLPTGDGLELGAVTFPKTARLLTSAAYNLGLQTQVFSNDAIDLIGPSGTGSFGVYDGRSWALTESKPHDFFDDYSWFPFGRWGTSPRRVSDLIKNARKRLPYLHNSFTNIDGLVAAAGVSQLTQKTAEDFLGLAGVSSGFQREQLNPWVRGRYGQNLGTISALAAFMAADNTAPLVTVHEDEVVGTAALWERMATHTGATLNLRTRVEHLAQAPWGGWELTSATPFDTVTVAYDAVVVATPWTLTQPHLSTTPPLSTPPVTTEYTPLHITVFTSPFRLSPHPFHGNKNIPDLILTTPCSWEYSQVSGRSGSAGLGHAPFWSLAVLRAIVEAGERRWLYKLVSDTEFTDADVQLLVGDGHPFNVVHRHYATAAHPLLPPRSRYSKTRLEENLWYTGAMDELASGVEWASISGANIARLIATQWRMEGVRLDPKRRIPVPAATKGAESAGKAEGED